VEGKHTTHLAGSNGEDGAFDTCCNPFEFSVNQDAYDVGGGDHSFATRCGCLKVAWPTFSQPQTSSLPAVPTPSSTKQRSPKMPKRISRIHSPRPISAEGATLEMTAKQERSHNFDNARSLFIQARRLREARLTQSDSIAHG